MLDRATAEPTFALRELAQRIEAEHNAVAFALQTALAHAIAAGELLIEAKAKVRHGQWLKWLAANCSVPQRTAAHYMRLARCRKTFCDHNGNVLPFSVNAALRACSFPAPGFHLSHQTFALDRSFDRLTHRANGDVMNLARYLLDHPADRGGIEPYEPRHPLGSQCGPLAWGAFSHALETVTRLPRLNPPAPRYVRKAARAGKTPGLTADSLRAVIALLTRYADALEGVEPIRGRAGEMEKHAP